MEECKVGNPNLAFRVRFVMDMVWISFNPNFNHIYLSVNG